MIDSALVGPDTAKVKNLADCMASHLSWKVSENFEKTCKELPHMSEGALMFSL